MENMEEPEAEAAGETGMLQIATMGLFRVWRGLHATGYVVELHHKVVQRRVISDACLLQAPSSAWGLINALRAMFSGESTHADLTAVQARRTMTASSW